jgi:hypothetical protein
VESAYLNQLVVMKIVSKSRSKLKAYFHVIPRLWTGKGQALDR